MICFSAHTLRLMRQGCAGLFALALIAPGALAGAPVAEIEEVDAANFPEVSVRFRYVAPGPDSVSRPGPPAIRLAEIYGDREWNALAEPARPLRTEAERLDLVLIVDATRSMPPESFRAAVSAAQSLAAALQNGDRVALYSLAEKPELLSSFTVDRQRIQTLLGRLERRGRRTRIYDALYSGVYTAAVSAEQTRLAGESARARTAVALFTDAREEDSLLTDNDVFEVLGLSRQVELPIYTILYGRPENVRPLERLAIKTGGQVLHAPAPAALAAFAKDLRRLRQIPYEIRFRSRAASDGDAWPGDRVTLRLAAGAGDVEYTALAVYRIPLAPWFKRSSPYVAGALIVAGLVLLGILALLVSLVWFAWTRLRVDASRLAPGELPAVAPHDAPAPAPRSAAESPPDDELASYLVSAEERSQSLGGDAEESPLSADAGQAERQALLQRASSGVLMDQDRALYMREYAYRLTQLALREAPAYQRATLTLKRSLPEPGGRDYDLFLDATVIGSGRWSNIPVRDDSVNPVHARIKRVDGRYVIYDLLSTSGVYVNGKRLLRPRGLCDGDEIRIGRALFQFQAAV